MPADRTIRISTSAALLVAAAVAANAGAANAQAQTRASGPTQPAVGQLAPDFALVGASRYGVLRDSVRLSSFRGQTVVLAFFYKARTKG